MQSERSNLLVLGASGSVAQAFLRSLPAHRHRIGTLVLLDRSAALLSKRWLDHRALRYRFFREKLRVPGREDRYRELLKRHRIDVVLDVTDHDTLPLLAATDAAGVSYINTCLSARGKSVQELVHEVYRDRVLYRRAPHILCSGMNPGAVNLWVVHGIEKHGTPREVVHFEYDTSCPVDGWRPVITWSRKEYLSETVWTPSGVVAAGEVKPLYPNALTHRIPMEPILRPIISLRRYPCGFTILHEENLTVSRRFGVPSKFIYALDPRTMNFLVRTWKERGTVRVSDLCLADNVRIPLAGGEYIGVYLEYDDRRVYYFNEMSNAAVVGTSATCAQVALSIYAALFTLLYNRPSPGIHFVGDLYPTSYPHFLFDNLRVQEIVFNRRRGELVRTTYNPILQMPARHRGARILV